MGVSSLAAIELGAFSPMDESYDSLKDCLSNYRKNPFIRRATISAIGNYVQQKPDASSFIKPIIEKGDKSYFVEIEALMAIANAKDEYSLQKLIGAIEKADTFVDIIP